MAARHTFVSEKSKVHAEWRAGEERTQHGLSGACRKALCGMEATAGRAAGSRLRAARPDRSGSRWGADRVA